MFKKVTIITVGIAAMLATPISSSFADDRGAQGQFQSSHYGSGEYDRAVNGSVASTPGQN